jgi:predicted permease
MRWYQRLFRRARTEKQLDKELRFHLEQQIADYVAAGVTPDEARRRARLEFGGLGQVKEECRDVGAARFVETLIQDLRYGLRQLRRNPGFTAVAVITLALGIGANTAIFSVIEAVLLRPLPYKESSRLAILGPSDATASISYRDYEAWRAQSRSFEDLAVYYTDNSWSRVILTGTPEPEAVQGAFVSANFFPLMGVSPLLGRVFTSREETRREHVVVLSYNLWARKFGASRDLIGKALQINGMNFQVIGVMPEDFQFPARSSELWAPLTTNPLWGETALVEVDPSHVRHFHKRWQVVGRLTPGVTFQEAQAEMKTIVARLQQVDPTDRDLDVRVEPLRVNISGEMRLALWLLFGAVSLVLLIACSNVANLVLARGAVRRRELAVRAALGAGRARLMRQLFTESGLLGLLSGLVGLVLAMFGIRALIAFAPPGLPRLEESGLDPWVLAFTFGVALFAAALFGLFPAWKVSRGDPSESLKAASKGASGSVALRRMQSLLVAAQFALSVVLLAGGVLLIRSFLAVEAVNPGFQPGRVLTMSVTFPVGAPVTRLRTFDDSMLARVRGLPGVRAVGGIDGLFELGSPHIVALRSIEGRVFDPRERSGPLIWDTVCGDFFQAMGVPLLKGRFFSERDGPDSPLVAIIDESMARRYWPHEDPIGARIKGQDRRGRNDEWVTVIGEVGDVRNHGLDKPATPHVFEWYRQSGDMTPDLVVRTIGSPRALAGSLRSVVRTLDRTAILSPVTTLKQQLSEQLSPRRFQTWLLSLFSLIALLLSALGIYGVMHYSVAQRTHEMGIRMALGAQKSDVLQLVVGQGMILAVVGEGIGIIGALGITRFMSSLLYGVKPTDPVTFVAVSLLLLGVALLACYIPARRATKVDPMVALRHE